MTKIKFKLKEALQGKAYDKEDIAQNADRITEEFAELINRNSEHSAATFSAVTTMFVTLLAAWEEAGLNLAAFAAGITTDFKSLGIDLAVIEATPDKQEIIVENLIESYAKQKDKDSMH